MRFSTGIHLLIWTVLTGVQLYGISQINALGGGTVAGILCVVQVIKALAAIPRLNDLGRPPDDALIAVVPLASIGLWLQLAAATPSKRLRDKRLAAWANEPMAVNLFAFGVRTMLRYIGPTLLFAVPFAAGAVAVDLYVLEYVLSLPATAADSADVLWQGMLAVTVFLFVVFVLQVLRRDRASRGSWWSSLLIVPMGLMTAAFFLGGVKDIDLIGAFGNPQGNDQLMPYLLGTQSMWLLYALVPGGLLATFWACVAVDATERIQPVVAADPLAASSRPKLRKKSPVSRAFDRFSDVGAVNGGAVLAIALGMLILVPGIIYALQYAFVPVVALQHPETRALRHSTDDSRPIRRRLFKVLFLGFIADVAMGVVLMFISLTATSAEVATGLGLGIGWVLGQIPPELTGLPPLVIFAVTLTATLAWGAARIGVAHAWLVREGATPA